MKMKVRLYVILYVIVGVALVGVSFKLALLIQKYPLGQFDQLSWPVRVLITFLPFLIGLAGINLFRLPLNLILKSKFPCLRCPLEEKIIAEIKQIAETKQKVLLQ